MISRVGVAAALLAVTVAAGVAAGSPAGRQPPTGTAMYLVTPARLAGYEIVIVNGVRTHCVDGRRHRRCHVARAVDGRHRPLADIPEGTMVRGAMARGRDGRVELIAGAAYAPAGNAAVSGGFNRVVDNGIRCVRAPCFSYTVSSVNARTRGRASSLDLQASGGRAGEIARALRAVSSKNGLYARGRFARTADGGTVFRAFRLYLRAPLPRA